MSSHASITLRNDLAELARLEGFITEYCQQHEIPAMDLNLVAEECFVNVVGHGYRDQGQHRIELSMEIQDGTLTMILEDDAAAFDPLSVAAFDPETPLEQRPVGGLGIHLMRSLMDDLQYQRVGGINRLTMRKLLNGIPKGS